MAAHRYWRIKYRNGATSQTGCGQIEMATAPGGGNVCAGGTAIASGSYGGAYAPGRAFDGDPAHNWFTAGGQGWDGSWIGYDFGDGNDKDIKELRVLTPPEGTNAGPYIFDFESSDDGLIWGFEWLGHAANWALGVENTFTKPTQQTSNRYWGILSEQTENLNRDMLIAELHMRTVPGGATVSPTAASYYTASGGFPEGNVHDNDVNTYIYAGVSGKGIIVSYDFTAATAIVEMAIIAAEAANGNNTRAPIAGRLLYSQDGFSWSIGGQIAAVSWTPFEEKAFDVEITEPIIHVQQAQNLVVYNIPTENMRLTAAELLIPYRRVAVNIDVTQSFAVAVHRGRIGNPRVRAWTFTLDGHDFYVLRLGDVSTLLYDVYSEQWIEWDSKDSFAWRANTGMSWIGGQSLANTYGSAVVVGDDTFGLLWFLDPELAWDEHPSPENPTQEIAFERIVTGQVLASGRVNIPCYVVFVDGDNYGLSATGFVPGVTLDYSDDQGRTFVTADTLAVETDITVENPYAWYSLGQISSPGRIFRVTDNGVFARIDSMDMNDDAG